MNFPADLRYTKDHEWIRVEGDEAVVGITDFAQRELGDIVYVEVETIGKELALGYVKRGFNSAGTRLAVFAMEDSEPTPVSAIAVEVVPLPFL